jgi:hypothetical protein
VSRIALPTTDHQETTVTDTKLSDLREAGLRLWTSVTDNWELDEHELLLLLQAANTADLLDELTDVLDRDGAIHDTPQGTRAHPAAVERRQQALTLARLVAALRLPAGADGDHQANARQPRRQGVRSVQAIRGVVS